jgi:DNA-binding CsgD family transcriptional regulator
VAFLEATYELELDDYTWLKSVSVATRDVWGRPGAIFSSVVDASAPGDFRVRLLVTEGVPEELAAAFIKYGAELATPELIARLYRKNTAGALRQIAPELVPALAKTEAFGVNDSFGIFGSDPDGLCCSVTVSSTTPIDAGPEELMVYNRMAAHLGAALRCRSRLRTEKAPAVNVLEGAEAVFDSSGRVLHAEGPAKETRALTSLKEAVTRFDRARRPKRGQDPLVGIAEHRPLVDARWTLVDTYEREGARYVVARENQAAVRGLASLSDRERQVAGFLALGRSTKEIGYSLGISDSTTRVLLARAATKLGARNRDELVEAITREALPELVAVPGVDGLPAETRRALKQEAP